MSLKAKWPIPEKIQTGRIEEIIFWKKPFNILALSRRYLRPWKFNPEKTKFHPWKFYKIVWYPLSSKFQCKKTRPAEIWHDFFLDHSWKFRFSEIDPWNFYMLFQHHPGHPGNSISSTIPPPSQLLFPFFSGIVQWEWCLLTTHNMFNSCVNILLLFPSFN